MAGPFIDFSHVKSNADVAAVLEALGLEGRRAGQEIRIRCPRPDHDDRRASCDVNTDKRTFYCHSCQATGSIIDLVALVVDTDARGASIWLHEHCGVPLSDRAHPRSPGRKARGRSRTERNKPPAPPAEAEDADAEFVPFETELKLDPGHVFGAERGFDAEAIAEFAMGYQDRGLFKGRWCLPIHDDGGRQLGYTGRWAGKRLPQDTEKWLLPKGFPKSEVLFNMHRASFQDSAVILVEGPFDAVRLHGLGVPVVALLGTRLSDRQIDLLATREVAQVMVMLDGDAPGRKAVPELLAKLARWVFVRDIKLPDGHDPETVPEDFLREMVWWL